MTVITPFPNLPWCMPHVDAGGGRTSHAVLPLLCQSIAVHFTLPPSHTNLVPIKFHAHQRQTEIKCLCRLLSETFFFLSLVSKSSLWVSGSAVDSPSVHWRVVSPEFRFWSPALNPGNVNYHFFLKSFMVQVNLHGYAQIRDI